MWTCRFAQTQWFVFSYVAGSHPSMTHCIAGGLISRQWIAVVSEMPKCLSALQSSISDWKAITPATKKVIQSRRRFISRCCKLVKSRSCDFPKFSCRSSGSLLPLGCSETKVFLKEVCVAGATRAHLFRSGNGMKRFLACSLSNTG